MKCADCGNENTEKMTIAAKGKRVYCLICMYSWGINLNSTYYKRRLAGQIRNTNKSGPKTRTVMLAQKLSVALIALKKIENPILIENVEKHDVSKVGAMINVAQKAIKVIEGDING